MIYIIITAYILGYIWALHAAFTNLKFKERQSQIVWSLALLFYPIFLLMCVCDRYFYDHVFGSPFAEIKAPKELPKVRFNPKFSIRKP